MNARKNLNDIYYYRDKEKNEIDFIIEDDNNIYAIEVKKSATINEHWADEFKILNKIKNKKIIKKIVICQVDKIYNISNDTIAMPLNYI